MGTYKSDDGKTSFTLQNEDFTEANGSKSFEFSCRVTSFEFSASINGVWFDDDVLISFSKDLVRLTNNEVTSVKLAAMSDFELNVSSVDNLGHFRAAFNLNSPVQGNNACLTVNLNTQSLIDFSEEIKTVIQNP